MRCPGYWLDIGTPEAYLQAHRDVLERNFVTELGDALGPDYTLVADGREREPGGPARAARVHRRGRVDRRGRPHRQPRGDRRGRVIGEGACVEASVVGAGATRRRAHARLRLDPR